MKWRMFLYASAIVFGLMAVAALIFVKFPLEGQEIEYLSDAPFKDDEANARIERKIKPFLDERYLDDVYIEGAKYALMDLDWIESAAVRRRPPSTLEITIKPKEIIGSVRLADGAFMAIDSRGKVINERFAESSLPVVSGDGAAARLPRLLHLLSGYSELRQRLKSARLIDGLRWDLDVEGKGGMALVRLPADDADAALDKIIWEGLLMQPLSEIDARAGAKIFVRER